MGNIFRILIAAAGASVLAAIMTNTVYLGIESREGKWALAFIAILVLIVSTASLAAAIVIDRMKQERIFCRSSNQPLVSASPKVVATIAAGKTLKK